MLNMYTSKCSDGKECRSPSSNYGVWNSIFISNNLQNVHEPLIMIRYLVFVYDICITHFYMCSKSNILFQITLVSFSLYLYVVSRLKYLLILALFCKKKYIFLTIIPFTEF